MHVGVPCLVSDRVGCQQDLVTPGETGWVFPAGNGTALAATLEEALTAMADPVRRDTLETSVRERISHYSYAAASDGVREALQRIMAESCELPL